MNEQNGSAFFAYHDFQFTLINLVVDLDEGNLWRKIFLHYISFYFVFISF